MAVIDKIKAALLEWNGEGVNDMIAWLDKNVKKSKFKDDDFFVKLAEGLRPLWPAGDKSEKYPWRDSVPNLAKRLENLWDIRELGDYSIDTCLTVARRYLARYEENAKYMQTLKYFILKQDHVVGKDGRINYISKSVFADMLESTSVYDGWDDVFESTSTYEQGELI